MNNRYPKIENVSLTTADQEYRLTVPVDTKKFLMQVRTGEAFKVAYKTGDIALDKYFTVQRGMGKMEENLNLSEPLAVFVSCATAGVTLEVEVWS